MRAIYAILFLLLVIGTAAAECGDDICGSGENCTTCIWDCGVCNESSGNLIGTKPAPVNVSIWDGTTGYHDCPVAYSSYVSSGNANTSIRIKILNNFSSSTAPFRLSLSSTLSWFKPKNLTFSFRPDGYLADGSPYWDSPGLGPFESTEVFFVVNGSVGLVSNIHVKADYLDKWKGGCRYFAPFSGSARAQNITSYLNHINQSQNVTFYYENGNLILTRLEKNKSFVVFGIYGMNVTPIIDNSSIEKTVYGYLKSVSPIPSTDPGKPFQILNYSRALKQGPQDNCMKITGMDKHDCVDRNSCRYACASVPVCWYIGQIGWPFIDSMLSYKTAISKTNQVLDDAINASFQFSQSPSINGANETLIQIGLLNRNETAVIYHPLFSTYNFCPPPEYAIPQQIEAKRQLLDYMDENCAWLQQGRMENESKAMGAALKKAEADFINRTANISANATGNITGNVTGNATGNITGNATLNQSTNATINITQNATGNATSSNATINVTKNATNNASVNTTTQNASTANGTASSGNIGTYLADLYARIKKSDICSGIPLPFIALAGAYFFRNRKEK